nr:type IV secretion system protein TraC [Altericroceibacterium spongiae]
MFGDKRQPDETPSGMDAAMLSKFLPYQNFDSEKKIFENRKSRGFVVELAPLVGADERVGEILNTIFTDVLMPGACFAIHNYASPRISEKLQGWALPRVQRGGVFAKLSKYRIEKLTRGAWDSLASDGPFNLRRFEVVIDVSIANDSSLKLDDLLTMRESLIAAFDAINVPTRIWTPVELIRFFDEIMCPSTGAGDDVVSYNRFDPIQAQCIRHDVVTHVDKHRLVVEAPSLRATGEQISGVPDFRDYVPDKFDIRTLAPRNFPDVWAPWDGQKTIGDIFNSKLRLPCPTLQSLSGQVQSSEESQGKAGYKGMRTTSLSDGKSARFLPNLKKQSAEWQYASERIETGEKLVRAYYSVSVISPYNAGEKNARAVKAMFKACGWDLIDQTYIQLAGFMNHFPLLMADGFSSDLDRFSRKKTFLSSSVAALAPFHGEYVGGDVPHVLLIGRRGQPQFFSPFQNNAGNHNCSIIGKSGSGKSVLLQDFAASFAGAGAKTIIIDDGRSFEHMCKAVGGTFTEFKLSSGISVNPFRMIDAEIAERDSDYLVDCLAMLKSIVAQMARNESKLSETERGLIDRAVGAVWERCRVSGTIDDIIHELNELENPVASDLATAMLPFSSDGTFGQFFVGENNLDLAADLTVFELSDLASREELRSVVLTSVMFHASQIMRRMDRSIPKILMIDEAWQLLKGGEMAQFIETYARTCRKYGGALVTATQSINDFYKSEGSLAALENSDWTINLMQKPETISGFKKSDRFEMDHYTESLLRSLKRNGVDYSDVLVTGPDTQFVGRLVLDPFSATLYSSSPDVFAKIERLVHTGLAMPDAIEAVAFGQASIVEEKAA